MAQLAENTPAKSFISTQDSPCGGFMAIPTLIPGSDGRLYINPDFDYVKEYHVAASPFPGSSGYGVTPILGPGEQKDFIITVPAEENHLGDQLISELRAQFIPVGAPGTPVRSVFTEILSYQNDRLFQNAPIESSLLYTDGSLGCCLPCCMLLQANNSMSLRVSNNEAFSVECRIISFGKRFLPYHYPELRERYLAFWNQIPITPYYLGLDQGPLTLAPGATVTALMTVPGGGDFESMWPRASVVTTAGTDPETDIMISVAEGIGRTWETQPLPLGLETTITRIVPGFPNNGLWRASQQCPCPRPTMLFKRNTRMRVIFTNNGADPATISYAHAGCMHYVSECPPGNSLDRIRSLEPTIGPMLIGSDRCPPFKQMVPVPGRGFQPVPQPTAQYPQGVMQQEPSRIQQPFGTKPFFGPGYGAALPGGFLGMQNPQPGGARPPQRRPGNGTWRSL